MANIIEVVHVTKGTLEKAEAPAWRTAKPGNIIPVEGKGYMVEEVKGDLEKGPATINVRD